MRRSGSGFLSWMLQQKADTPADTQAAGTQAAGSEAAGSEAATEAAKANTDFPKKNIKIIVPYDAGGGVDITTRILAEAAGKITLTATP